MSMRRKAASCCPSVLRSQVGRDDAEELAVAFKVANPPNLDHFKKAGFDAFVDRDDGEVYLSRNGGRPARARDL